MKMEINVHIKWIRASVCPGLCLQCSDPWNKKRGMDNPVESTLEKCTLLAGHGREGVFGGAPPAESLTSSYPQP
jgi:hypothetical protein